MRFAVTAIAAMLLAPPLAAQSRVTPRELPDVLPADASAEQLAPRNLLLSSDGRRVYHLGATGGLWAYDRELRTDTQIVEDDAWMPSLSAAGNLIAYVKSGELRREQHVWVMPLSPATGLPAGAERRLTPHPGDAPSVSPDGSRVAYARDDSTGVGQSLVVVPMDGSSERVVAPALPSSLSNIQWSPDGQQLFFAVEPPLPFVCAVSCITLERPMPRTFGSVRRVAASGGPATVVAETNTPGPGISPDGTMLVYEDTARAGVFIVSDLNGRRLDTLRIPSTETLQGWTGAATLLTSMAGNVRRLGAIQLAGAEPRTLLETSDFSAGQPIWSPDGRAVAFVSGFVGDGCQLSTMGIEESAPRHVALPAGGCLAPALAADQKTLVFRSNRPNGSPMLTAVDLTTGRATELQDLAASGTRWTLDSLMVVVVELADPSPLNRVATIWHVSLAGERTRAYQLSLDPNTIVFPVDRTRVLLSRTTPRDFRLVQLSDRSERVILPPQQGFVAVDPSLSPDRRWAAFRINPNGADNRTMNVVEVVELGGGGRHTLRLPFSAEAGAGNPAIVQGGRGVVVIERREPNRPAGVFLVDVETSAATRLLDAAPVARIPEIVASPDGMSLLFSVSETVPPVVSAWDLAPLRPAARP